MFCFFFPTPGDIAESQDWSRPSTHLIVAPQLQGLEITARLGAAYDRMTWEALSMNEELHGQVLKGQLPEWVWHKAFAHSNEPWFAKLMPELRKKAPLLHDFVVRLQGVCFVSGLVEGEITDELLRQKREQAYQFLRQCKDVPYEMVELWLSPYQKRPRKRPSAKATRYLQALDFKNANPRTSWGELAREFCGDSSQANTLKAWAYRKQKELAKMGVPIRLDRQ